MSALFDALAEVAFMLCAVGGTILVAKIYRRIK